MITCRPEYDGEQPAIHTVVARAFANHPYSEGTEPMIVDMLRQDDDLLLSLVIENDGVILGHVAFSPARLSDCTPGWMALGPISVDPKWQGQGFGRMLVEEGCRICRTRGAEGVILLGEPALYSRFGFIQNTPITMVGALAPYLQVLPFTKDIPAASVSFAPAFALARIKNR